MSEKYPTQMFVYVGILGDAQQYYDVKLCMLAF